MNISFYTAAVGAAQQQQRLDIHGNNIANHYFFNRTAIRQNLIIFNLCTCMTNTH